MKKVIAALGLVAVASISIAAEEAASMLPAFGSEGTEIAVNAKDNNKIKGWLPKDWVDNSEWAAVSATYTKLTDAPKANVTAVSIKVEKVDDGQLQFTSWTKPTFKKGVKYVIEGWIRSKEKAGIKVGIRQPEEPYEFYAEQSLEGTEEWKQFTFEFSLNEDKEAFVMFYKQETGTVDLAGLVVREKK